MVNIHGQRKESVLPTYSSKAYWSHLGMRTLPSVLICSDSGDVTHCPGLLREQENSSGMSPSLNS